MARVKSGVTAHARHKKILKLAKGYRGARHTQFRKANELVMKALYYARRDRRSKKREFRKLWIVRINAAARQNGLTYSKLIAGLTRAGIEVNRKMLSELAIHKNPSMTICHGRIFILGEGRLTGKRRSDGAPVKSLP